VLVQIHVPAASFTGKSLILSIEREGAWAAERVFTIERKENLSIFPIIEPIFLGVSFP